VFLLNSTRRTRSRYIWATSRADGRKSNSSSGAVTKTMAEQHWTPHSSHVKLSQDYLRIQGQSAGLVGLEKHRFVGERVSSLGDTLC